VLPTLKKHTHIHNKKHHRSNYGEVWRKPYYPYLRWCWWKHNTSKAKKQNHLRCQRRNLTLCQTPVSPKVFVTAVSQVLDEQASNGTSEPSLRSPLFLTANPQVLDEAISSSDTSETASALLAVNNKLP